MQGAAARAAGEKQAPPASPQRWCWLPHSPGRSRCASPRTHHRGLWLPGGSHSAPTAAGPRSPDPTQGRVRSHCHPLPPCPSSPGIAQRRHKISRRGDRTKRQETPGTASPSRWGGQSSPGQPTAAGARCPRPAPHRRAAARHGLGEMQKDRPVLELLIAKLFGRKRKV